MNRLIVNGKRLRFLRQINFAALTVAFVIILIVIPVRAQSTPPPSSTPTSFLGAVTNATANGAYIGQIVPRSPADLAGLLVGDVIESVNGISVTTDVPLNALLKNYQPGAQVLLTVGRGNNSGWLPIWVTLGTRQVLATETVVPNGSTGTKSTPLPVATSTTSAPPGPSSTAGFLGIGLINTGGGLQIAKVAVGSPAEQVGIQIGDILISLDGIPMTAVPQVQTSLTAKTPGTHVTIVIHRNNQAMTLMAILSAAPGVTMTPVSISITSVPGVTPSVIPGIQSGTQVSPQSDIAPTGVGNSTIHLGVTYDVLTPALATAKQLPVTDGAFIVTIEPGSPASAAGLQVGDIVIAVDGDKVDVKHTLAIRLVAYNAGDTFKLTVIRETQTLILIVTLATRGSA